MTRVEGSRRYKPADIIIPTQEANRRKYAAFLGGIFAVAGGMSFRIDPLLSGGSSVLPKVSLGGKRDKLEDLQRVFGGGRITPKASTGDAHWELTSATAVVFAETMRGYCPSRKDAIDAFHVWEMLEESDDRMRLAKEINIPSQVRNNNVSQAAYRYLITDPLFLAGIVYARGSFSLRERVVTAGSGMPEFFIHSENKPLLDSLREMYGGYKVQPHDQGSYFWGMGAQDTQRFFNIILQMEVPQVPQS